MEIAAARRRWYQFSLRTLLIAMLLTSVALGLGVSVYRRAARHAEAVSTLEQLEVDCYHEGHFKTDGLGRVVLNGRNDSDELEQVSPNLVHRVTGVVQQGTWDGGSHYSFRLSQWLPLDEWQRRRETAWKAIAALDDIEYLHVEGKIPPAGLETLRHLSRLRTLIMGPAAVPESLEPIVEISTLETLELDASTALVTSRSMAEIGRLPKLRHLGFPRTHLEAGHLGMLAEVSQIKSLNLEHADVTRDGIEALRGLSSLKRLSLRGTAADDSWGQALEPLSSLEELDLSETAAGPAVMESLAKLPNLRQLNTSRTKITGRSIVKFLESHPDCQFVWGENGYR